MELRINQKKRPDPSVLAAMHHAAALALEREHLDSSAAEVSLTFVSAEEIRRLNRECRGMDRVTDVLSFPQFDDVAQMQHLKVPGPLLLGDVVICVSRAEEQAVEYGHSIERELVYLFVHSLFHLLGYDHMEPDQKQSMRQAEEDIMHRLGLERENGI